MPNAPSAAPFRYPSALRRRCICLTASPTEPVFSTPENSGVLDDTTLFVPDDESSSAGAAVGAAVGADTAASALGASSANRRLYVVSPTMPSAIRPHFIWNAVTACLVMEPKLPVMGLLK